jgi:multicomponent Na+:H+ antiporter subunit F
MNIFFLLSSLFLLLTIIVGFVRLIKGPSLTDRILAVQLFGSTGISILLLFSAAFSLPSAINIALVFALLSVMTVAGFVKYINHDKHE